MGADMSPASVLGWAKTNLFRRWSDAALTLAFAAGAGFGLVHLWSWAVERASFSPHPEACRRTTGACWSVVVDMWPLFLAGLYPPDERWRAVAGLALLGCGAAAAIRAGNWRSRAGIWSVAVVAFLLLVHGGVAGLRVVESQKWGGILLTAVLASVSQTLAFPLGLCLGVARWSPRPAILRAAAATYVEILRSVPLVMVLLMTTLVMPLFLPPSWPLDTVVTAAMGLTLFSAAAIAEVVRGGLNGVGPGQREAALSLGLRPSQTLGLVLLPQALAMVRPALLGTFITFVKGSTLVVAIGLYDLLGAAVLASSNPSWVGHSVEPLVFVGFAFWAVCYSLSCVSRRLEGWSPGAGQHRAA
jgi:general L-amino acid transport system permease protein